MDRNTENESFPFFYNKNETLLGTGGHPSLMGITWATLMSSDST